MIVYLILTTIFHVWYIPEAVWPQKSKKKNGNVPKIPGHLRKSLISRSFVGMGYVLSESLSERAGFLPFLLWQRIAHDIVMFNQTSQNYLIMNSFVHMLCNII